MRRGRQHERKTRERPNEKTEKKIKIYAICFPSTCMQNVAAVLNPVHIRAKANSRET